MRLSRVRSVLLAFLVVSSAVLASPGVGTVAAIHDCSNKDAAVYGFTFGYVNEDKCTNNHVDQAVERVRSAESQQTKVDLHAAAAAQKTRDITFNAVSSNYIDDSESAAWMKAEAAIAEVYERGGTKTQAKSEAKSAIADYYAVKQINVLEDWNATASAIGYLIERRDQEGFSKYFVKVNGQYDRTLHGVYSPSEVAGTYTLTNGTTHGYLIINTSSKYDNGQYDFDSASTTDEIIVEPPSSDYDPVYLVEYTNHSKKLYQIKSKQENLNSEVDAYVDATWQDYQDGNINSSDVLSRTTTMFEYGTNAQNGSYYDVIGANAAMGLETPRLNETGQMTISLGSGETVDGMLFARNPPNGTWQVGQTYDPANISGPVQVATTSGEMKELSRPFTVESATDKEGNSRETVETTRYNYKTADTSETTSKYNDLLGLTKDLQQRSESVESEGGGGGSSGGGTLPDWLTQSFFGIPAWVFAALLLLALVIFGGGS